MKAVEALAATKHEELEEKHNVAKASSKAAAEAAVAENAKLHSAEVKKKMDAANVMYENLQ